MEMEPPNSIFTCFSQLPVELRLTIWEAACLPCPDSRALLPIKHSQFEVSRLSMERSTITKTTMQLLRTCRESRDVALASGSFMLVEEMICGIAMHEGAWVDNRFTNLLLPEQILADKPLHFIPHNIQYITVLSPSARYLNGIRDYITRTTIQGRPRMIETIYIAVMYIPWISNKDDTFATSPCVNSDTTMVPLDDEMLPKYVASAYKVHALHVLDKPLSEEVCLENAKRYLEWTTQWRHRETISQHGRSSWEALGMKIKLAAIFVSRGQFSRSQVATLKERQLFSWYIFMASSDYYSEEDTIFSLGFLWDFAGTDLWCDV
ncbi:hypothetical protein FGRMN_6716 [Fusarium graminum]|nr:hypothetical protein FGRMN_6716 [Fusarium graminum]